MCGYAKGVLSIHRGFVTPPRDRVQYEYTVSQAALYRATSRLGLFHTDHRRSVLSATLAWTSFQPPTKVSTARKVEYSSQSSERIDRLPPYPLRKNIHILPSADQTFPGFDPIRASEQHVKLRMENGREGWSRNSDQRQHVS